MDGESYDDSGESQSQFAIRECNLWYNTILEKQCYNYFEQYLLVGFNRLQLLAGGLNPRRADSEVRKVLSGGSYEQLAESGDRVCAGYWGILSAFSQPDDTSVCGFCFVRTGQSGDAVSRSQGAKE